MPPGLNELAASISWGDVPTWVAALGTSGTLITGMYIILRDRLNEYRSQFDDLRITVRISIEPGPEGKDLYLSIINNSWAGFDDLKVLS